MAHSFDIAIIGGGPAGLSCALALKDSGLSVVLIEKSIFPRDKICGDAIPGPAFKVMDSISKDFGKKMRAFANQNRVQSSRVFAPNKKTATVHWVTFSYNSKRIDFDNFLFDLLKKETKTQIFQGKYLKKAIKTENGILLKLDDSSEIIAKLAIGCDGANSVLAREMKGKIKKETERCAAVRAYFSNVKDVQKGLNEFHLLKGYMPGYFWLFPLDENTVNIGFGTLPGRMNGNLKNLRKTLDEIISTESNLAERFQDAQQITPTKGFALPLGTRRVPISGKRWMLCGDAAALIDPVQGHGIHTAMLSGREAARIAMDCFKTDRFDANFLKKYDKSVYGKIGFELKRNTLAMRLICRFPFLVNILVWFGRWEKVMNKCLRFLKV